MTSQFAGPAYEWLAEHLASIGMVVIAHEHEEQFDPELNMLWQTAVTRPADINALLAYEDQESGAGGSLEGLADTDSVAMVGHSYGGYTALVEGGAQIDTAGFTTRCENTAADDPGAWLCG